MRHRRNDVNRNATRVVLWLFIAFVLFGVARPCFSEQRIVSTEPAKANYYSWITFLSQGATVWFENNPNAKVQGRAYRVAVVVSEIYSTVYLEEVTLGPEGCCKKLSRVRRFDLEFFAASHGFHGELSGFQFVRWLTPTSFVFSYKGRNFVMSEINKAKVQVEPYFEVP